MYKSEAERLRAWGREREGERGRWWEEEAWGKTIGEFFKKRKGEKGENATATATATATTTATPYGPSLPPASSLLEGREGGDGRKGVGGVYGEVEARVRGAALAASGVGYLLSANMFTVLGE